MINKHEERIPVQEGDVNIDELEKLPAPSLRNKQVAPAGNFSSSFHFHFIF